ncbi:actin cortical patch SUR7/pH-response regulator pali [Desarmillaria tabescens]|uniref:Actin cortical patch SUR7/pH-response regulator pali n=1 Tax=Armillaria tabescens TaxID=1929756 RepID=A0AA39KFP4_ARMTA|nr:actin cortical patch SUR7/pH-response regulator pali [Desarmillaria tabescens]KAK0459105.1 actin cortical patch SUR7/pH-response regulator pali [Desarmillaria tabescens]
MKPHHRPFAVHRKISIVSLALLFVAFLLLLLVGISLPIIKTIYLIRVYSTAERNQPATSIATELRFGVWGVCATSALNRPSLLTNDGECFGPRLGYDIPSSVTELVGVDASLVQVALKGLLVILILHIVAAGLSLAALIPAMCLGSHAFAIVALVLSMITAILGTVVFGVDLALVLVLKNKLPSLSSQVDLGIGFGNGIWMVLVAVVLTWVAVITLSARACFCCGVRRKSFKY